MSLVSDERGAATVAAAVALVALVSLTGGGVCVGAAVVARHRAQAAADLAALTAATVLVGGEGTACAQAAAVAQRMGAALTDCTAVGLDVTVRIEIAVELGRFAMGPARAAARAGPTASSPRGTPDARSRRPRSPD